MNEKFFVLPQEKQARILNAALKCFAAGGYKRTVTDDIAAQAGISKGLLFHYFENKKGLYEYLFGYSMRFVGEKLKVAAVLEGDDFFEIVRMSTHAKSDIMKKYPYIFDFTISAYYDEQSPAKDYIEKTLGNALERSTELMLTQVDRSKFRTGVSVETMLDLVFWAADGFMLRQQRSGNLHDLEGICEKFDAAMQELKRAFYKEEYL